MVNFLAGPVSDLRIFFVVWASDFGGIVFHKKVFWLKVNCDVKFGCENTFS